MAFDMQRVLAGPTVAELYVAALRANRDAVAVVADDRTLSYAELERASFRLARALRAKGLRRQDTLALLVGNRPEAVATLIAAQLLGLKSLSLHPMASEEDHEFVLSDSQAKAVVVDIRNHGERAKLLRASGVVPMVLGLDASVDGNVAEAGPGGLFAEAEGMDDSPFAPEALAQDITKISYTGGTTGRSKGILHAHRTTVTMIGQMLGAYEWPAQPRYLVTTPISHASGSLILPVLIRGGTIFLAEKFSASDFLARVRRDRINLGFAVPTQIYALLDDPALPRTDLSSLELVLYGAAPIAPVRLREALERIGPVFGQLYGQAEAPMTLTYLEKRHHDPAHPERLGSCGRILTGNRVALLDTDLREVPVGEIGEICVRGPLVMNGYLNRPEENEKVFAGDWLHTGDMARMDAQGFLYIVDRAKDMIITGGFNVFPSEIEACLAQHPAVAMSAVIGTPHEKWGEAVTAIVVCRPGCTRPTVHEIVEHVSRHKGVVHAPKQVFFEEALPLTALGKIDRKAIRLRYWSESDRQVG